MDSKPAVWHVRLRRRLRKESPGKTPASGKVDARGVRRAGDLKLIRRILGLARPYWLHIIGIFFLDLLKGSVVLLSPIPLKIAVDSVVGSQPLPGFLMTVVPDVVMNSDLTLLLFAAGLMVLISVVGKAQSLTTSL